MEKPVPKPREPRSGVAPTWPHWVNSSAQMSSIQCAFLEEESSGILLSGFVGTGSGSRRSRTPIEDHLFFHTNRLQWPPGEIQVFTLSSRKFFLTFWTSRNRTQVQDDLACGTVVGACREVLFFWQNSLIHFQYISSFSYFFLVQIFPYSSQIIIYCTHAFLSVFVIFKGICL